MQGACALQASCCTVWVASIKDPMETEQSASHEDALVPEAFHQALVQRSIPLKQRPYWVFWVRCYVRYGAREADGVERPTENFFDHLAKKFQPWQCQQAHDAIGLYEEILAKLSSGGTAPSAIDSTTTNAQPLAVVAPQQCWSEAVQRMATSIRLKHYSESTVKITPGGCGDLVVL